MATAKALKLKEDARRKKLQDSIDEVLAAQELIVEQLHELLTKVEALDEPEEGPAPTKPRKKVTK